MGRPKGATELNAITRKRQIMALHAEGRSARDIGATVGCSHVYVLSVVKSFQEAATDKETVIRWCLERKDARRREGADRIIWHARKHFGDDANYPSATHLEALFRADDLLWRKPSVKKDKLRIWQRHHPKAHDDLYLCDLKGPFMVDGKPHVIFACISDTSRIVWAELLPKNYIRYLPWAIERCYTALGGAPVDQKCDNGIGLIRTGHNTVGPFVQMIFNLGATYITYTPEGEPERNGKIEAFNNTLSNEFIGVQPLADMPIAEARRQLISFLIEYNTDRPHSSKGMTAPSDHGTFNPLAPALPEALKVPATRHGTLCYWRRIDSRGNAINRVNSEIYEISPAVAGNYAEIAINWETREGTITVDRKVIGSFHHQMDSRRINRQACMITTHIDPNAVSETSGPKRYDEAYYLKKLSRRLKNRISDAPTGLRVVYVEGEGSYIYDEDTGECLLSPETIGADHLDDVGIFTESL